MTELAQRPSRRPLRRALAALAIGAAALAPIGAASQDYPNKPVRIIVPFGPGGLGDVTMRIASEKFSELLGQQFVVENHPGAGGASAANELLAAEPDGYTLILMSNGTTIATSLFENLGYDPQEQFAPISTVAWFDLVLFTNKDSDLDTVQAVIDKAKAEPGILNIATINPGSTQNLAAEYFRSAAGIDANIIPYRTSPDVQAALMRGEVDLAFESYTAFASAIGGEEIRPIAVTGVERNPALPDVPTVMEAGLEGYDVRGWNALYALKGTPPEVIATLHDTIAKVTAMPEIDQRYAELGTNPGALTPAEMAERFEADRQKWADVIDTAGIEKR